MTLSKNLQPDYRFAAVIGHPIEHSLSPLMHNTAFQKLGLPYLYTAYDIEPGGLRAAVEELKENFFIGFNVTIPHKETILNLLDDLDYEANHIGAVNTVSIQQNRLIGYNTDVHGILKSLEPYQQQIADKNVLVLGIGGAARAVLFALRKYFEPAKIVLAARSEEKAKSTLASLKINVTIVGFPPPLNAGDQFALVVNATPVGMHPHDDASPIEQQNFFHVGQIVFDLIYRPLETKFLKKAREAGATPLSGLEMFINQGAKSFEIWTGKQMPVDDVRKTLEEELRKDG